MEAKNPFEVNDFSKGMTDNVHEQMPGFAAEIDNFLIGSDKKPISRFGSEIEDSANPEIPSGLRIGALVNYANSDKLIYQSLRALYIRNPSAFSELFGPTGNHAFSVGDAQSVPAFAQWNRHLYLTSDVFARPMKVFKDGSGVYQLRSQGLPELANSPTVTAGASGDFDFIYAFYFSVNYTVFDLDYETIGPVTEVELSSSVAPDVSPVTITNIPVLSNGSTDNYDLANVKVQIFRTLADGTFFQKVAEVPNGTTSYVDNMSDDTLQNTGEPLYINDGTVDFDPPPLHKFNHVVNNTQYFVHIKDSSGNISPYKVRQSVPGVPDTGPRDFEADVDDETVGVSSVQSLPIVFCKKNIFRIDGGFDQFGRGQMNPVRISDHAGLISHQSIVQAENGIFWFGNDGIYYSDGYLVNKITDHLVERYKDLLKNTTQASRIVGKYFEKERLIIWAVQTNSASQDNDGFWICDLKHGISDQMTILTWSGFKPSAIEIFNKDIYRGDPSGFIFRFSENLFSDPKINPYIPASDWVKKTIIWRLKTIHYNFGGTFYRKYPTRILFTAADYGNTTVQITKINDDGRVTKNCKVIRYRKALVWGDDDFVWRIFDWVWRGSGLIEQWRRFPAGGLRLSTLQLVITNGFSDITNSDSLGQATFDDTLKTVTLDTADRFWPVNSEDYFIATEDDGYVKEFLVTLREPSGTVLEINDPLDELPNGSLKWVIRGYKKDEPLHLLSFNVHWTNVSASQQTYHSDAASTGENA